jgi:tRNA (guanine-N7-)-methyltransferase
MNRYKKRVQLHPGADEVILNQETPKQFAPLGEGDFRAEQPFWDWESIFGNRRPVEAEIGFGTGQFLLKYAEQHPELNLLGIEITRKMGWHVANKVQAGKLANVRLAMGDGLLFLARHLAPRSLAAVHVYFPDPWNKMRHRKRRLINPLFLTGVRGRLQPGGFFYFATDHAEYLEHLNDTIRDFPEFRFISDAAPAHQSGYEIKWRRMQRRIYGRTYQLV